MNLILETERLVLRPMQVEDAEALFEMDRNPNVHLYLGNEPLTNIEECYGYIKSIQNQYIQNGIGRFVIVLKETNEVIGWAGLKFITEEENGHNNFYDIGYRLQEKHWRKGYALEAATAWLDYAFTEMKIPKIYASAHVDNIGSNTILKQIGLYQKEQYLENEIPCYWYQLKNKKE
ncbi:GNAT family N-acetyltransferase [Flavobacterium sp.]|uniref:GNAT family N-acetyltransferase n=1 Tax=Flavobacterium sp. TaxID=239 RepID=UPI0024870919|nr:GNAT family N-acetyltransferase [Flavobacterium sp.]MDI1316639.1 GNAT family N-acetyltransferase [Flavobacterium sp.]